MKLDRTELKKFGMTMGVAFFVIALLLFIKHKNINPVVALISAVFFMAGIILPRALKPVYLVWMKFAHILGWINTRIILCVIFYLIFVPMGVLIRLFGVDLLDRKISKDKKSYWYKQKTQGLGKPGYERQF